jgi:serine/threonine protein kinase/formylglycine-generating enzyme required for sulfatase activity
METRWREISRIFNAALEQPLAERRAFVAQRCQDDDSLKSDIEALLLAHEEDDSFIDAPEIGLTAFDAVPELSPGEKIGSFQIISLLGKGGMGEVYLARDMRLNRQVALKILPPASTSDPSANKRLLREARSAARLEHPNICAIHEIGEDGGRAFIVLQFIEGETLSAKLKEGKMSLHDALAIVIQVGDALENAHQNGVVHRDIKPANIMVTPGGQVKVLDFGLAKRIVAEDTELSQSQSLLSQPGLILGTVSYMSPEQARGLPIDGRTDIWSLGVILYEMAAGQTPFTGETVADKIGAILYSEPPPLTNIPKELAEIIEKTLCKNRDERYQNVSELLKELRYIRQELEFSEQLKIHVTSGSLPYDKTLVMNENEFVTSDTFRVKKPWINWSRGLILGVLALFLSVGAWFYLEAVNRSWAIDNIAKIEQLAKEDKYFEAYDLAVKSEKYLPPDSSLNNLMPAISDKLTVISEPAGAKVYLRRFSPDGSGKFPERVLVGQTPINDFRIARGQYILKIEKDGYAPFERSISGTVPRIGGSFILLPPLKIETKLLEAGQVPDKMVYIPASEYSLVNWSRPLENKVWLDDYFIDQYEVTNRDYKEFINTGGYLKKELWKVPFVKDGKILGMDEAKNLLKDQTGLPGPRSWSNQNYPEGKDNYPVTDITWYEAAAYAEFRGKKLPTIFQWEKAARNGLFDPRSNAMPWGFAGFGETTNYRANFRGTGTIPVDHFEFGISPFGAYNMAGNVAEWGLNQSEDGFVTSGGGWNDLAYSFGDYGFYPGFFSANRIGFRCVQNLLHTKGDYGAQKLSLSAAPVYKASPDNDFKVWLTHYSYDKTPLEASLVETTETDSWTREKISFLGANGEKAIGYLYLPKNYNRPVQVIHYLPAGDVVSGLRSLPDSIEMFLTPVIKSGRAVFSVVLKGYNERPYPKDYAFPDRNTVEFRKQAVNWVTDLRRGIDFLETRKDIDTQKLAFLGISNGANLGLLVTAIETRYKTTTFVGIGAEPDWPNWIPEANLLNFAPHVRQPKLIINGRYDEAFPLKTSAKPLYDLLREPKRLNIYEAGHVPTLEFFGPTVNNWFDESLGKVSR